MKVFKSLDYNFLLFFFLFIYIFMFLFIYVFIFGCVGSSLLRSGPLQLRRAGASPRCSAWLSRCSGLSRCGARAPGAWASAFVAHRLQRLWFAGSRPQAQQLWRLGLVAPRQVGSSWIRDRSRVPCIGRWTLSHCATREVPVTFLVAFFSSLLLL